MQTIRKNVIGIIVIALLSIFAGVILPGVILYKKHIFFEADVVARLDSSALKRYQQSVMENQKIESRRMQLLDQLKDTAQKLSPADINASYTALDNLDHLKNQNSNIKISPYYPRNRTLLIWPLLFFGLGCLIFFNRSIVSSKISFGSYFSLFLLLYFFWRGFAWFRNTRLGDIDRVMYAVNNLDISFTGFLIQEILSLISLLLLAYIYCKWIAYSEVLKRKFFPSGNPAMSDFLKAVTRLRDTYQQWQISTFFLTVTFGYYTYYFWSVINQTHDMRYLPQAIVIHFIWGLSWYVISLPLLTANNSYIYLKDFFTYPGNRASIAQDEKETFAGICSIDPISAQNKVITTIISGFTFLFPLIKSLF